MKLKRLVVLSLFLINSLNNGAYAKDLSIHGISKQTIPLAETHSFKIAKPAPKTKEIALLRIELSDKARKIVNKRVLQALATPAALLKSTPLASVQLGMNNVPVLDQGGHGTCVTFANTAAIDAALGQGDYVSQLCQLVLGQYLSNMAYSVSGWDGSLGPVVLNQMSLFGIVSKAQQTANGCGGLNQYPLYGANPLGEITLPEYHQMSEPIREDEISWSSIMDIYQATLEDTDMTQIMNKVKAVLREGDRVTYGVMLADTHLGVAGAIGTFKAANDTWILTPEIAKDLEKGVQLSGHEMVITGFDDAATAVDAQGRSYHGLFTLRGSWGSNVGDQGDFYMSYDYFRALIIEAQRIRTLVHIK